MNKKYTFAFYNLENLFDTQDDYQTADNDFLPYSRKKWTEKRYWNKLKKLSRTITQINENNEHPPAILGVAEVENKKVLQDLLNTKPLDAFPYEFVHFDSKDERGIDVALLYNPTVFEVEKSSNYPISFKKEEGYDFSRDILSVKGKINSIPIHLIITHWPSRGSGAEESEPKRIHVAHKIESLLDENCFHVVMGDFNDNPNNNSVQTLCTNARLINPFLPLKEKGAGSLTYKNKWFLFDQILLSSNHEKSPQIKYIESSAQVFKPKFLQHYRGRFKGLPFRTYVKKKYKGGYSDHFPVYIEIEINGKK